MRVLVGVSGGIAAYKAVELVRLLQQSGIDVDVAMTAGAERFVTPLTFAAITGRSVFSSLWQPPGTTVETQNSAFAIEHIAVAQQIDALVIAPATADLLARLAHGIADDFLTTLFLATRAPVIAAPAMNVQMWQHPATQANIATLRDRGVHIVEPGAGYLACGMTGSGRLADVEAIAAEVTMRLARAQDLAEETVLITAGGTREPIDPVRYLGNRSSGKMGHALAEEARARGASVILITASSLPAPAGCSVVRVRTAAEMEQAVLSRLSAASIVIGAAAVSDYRVREMAAHKLRRSGPLTLELVPTKDIMAEVVARRREETLTIAFAAETEGLETNARRKLKDKGVDAVVANDVSSEALGFETDRNAGLFLTADRTVALPQGSKRGMARLIFDEISTLRRESNRRRANHPIEEAARASN